MHHRTAEVPSAIDSRLRRYATRVTLGIIVVCNIILLVGLRVSGVDVNDLIRTPDVYDLQRDVCVRSGWHRVSGVDKPVRLCAEWINLSDRSGKTHQFQRDTLVVQGGGRQAVPRPRSPRGLPVVAPRGVRPRADRRRHHGTSTSDCAVPSARGGH